MNVNEQFNYLFFKFSYSFPSKIKLSLQIVVQYMFRDSIPLHTDKCRKSLYGGKSIPYKVKDSIPHDLGDPGKCTFTLIFTLEVKKRREERKEEIEKNRESERSRKNTQVNPVGKSIL